MSTATRRRPARLALVTALAVAAGALGVLPATPATAAQTGGVTDGSLSWGLSTYLNSTNPGRPNPHSEVPDYTAVLDAVSRVTTWGDAAGTVTSGGSATLTFEGTSVNWATTGNSWLKITDPTVTVDAAGVGALSATVSYGVTTGGVWSTATTTEGPEAIDLVDLSVSPQTGDATYPDHSATPFAFATTATAYTWSNLRGRWSPELLQFLWGSHYPDPPNGQAGDCAGSVGCWIYGSGVNNAVVSSVPRYPSLMSISLDRAVASTTTSFGTRTEAGQPVEVDGTGFKQTAPGVYVSLRETTAGAPAYAGGAAWADGPTNWVSDKASDIGPDPATGASASIAADGSFETTLLLTPAMLAKLDPTRSYSVVTRKAHGQGAVPANADQVTETPLDVSDLKEDTAVDATVADSVEGTDATVEVAVTGADEGTPDGAVTVKDGDVTVGTGSLTDGVASVVVPGLAAGAHELSVEYAGSSAFWPSADEVTATVTAKLDSTATITAPARSTYGAAAKVTVTVPGATGPVTLSGAGAAQTVQLTGGAAAFTLPATLAAGGYTLTATYAGDAGHGAATATKSLTVGKAGTRVAVKVAPKPTARKAGRATVTLTGAPGGSKVVVTIKGAGRTVKKAVKVNAQGKAVVALPKAAKGGSFTVTAAYAGDANRKAASGKVAYKVAKPKKR